MNISRPAKTLNETIIRGLRNAWWPCRHQFKHFSPLNIGRGDEEIALVVLGTPDRVPETIWATYTFLHWHPIKLRLVLAFDGAISDRSAGHIRSVLPHAEILDATSLAHAGDQWPSLSTFCAKHKYGRKLALLSKLNQDHSIIYLDSDIVFFRTSNRLVAAVQSGAIAKTHITVAPGTGYVTRGPLVDFIQAQNIGIPPGYNSGFFLAPKGVFDLGWLDHVLANTRSFVSGQPFSGSKGALLYMEGWDFFTEQSLTGASLVRGEYVILPFDTFVNTNDGMVVFRPDPTDYSNIVMRHYFGTVRHRMYMAGLPIAYQRMFGREAARPAASVRA